MGYKLNITGKDVEQKLGYIDEGIYVAPFTMEQLEEYGEPNAQSSMPCEGLAELYDAIERGAIIRVKGNGTGFVAVSARVANGDADMMIIDAATLVYRVIFTKEASFFTLYAANANLFKLADLEWNVTTATVENGTINISPRIANRTCIMSTEAVRIINIDSLPRPERGKMCEYKIVLMNAQQVIVSSSVGIIWRGGISYSKSAQTEITIRSYTNGSTIINFGSIDDYANKG